MTRELTHNSSPLRRRTIVGCGVIALLGCILVTAANLIGILVVDAHNPISETISKLAIGDYAWIQDLGLDAFAIGLFALALGLYLRLSGGWRWQVGLGLVVLLGIDVLLIAEHNQYAGRPGRGAAIHIYCVYALYALFAASTFLLAKNLKKLGARWHSFSLVVSVGWLVLAPFFFVVPDSWDGAYERFLALFILVWVGGLAWKLSRSYTTNWGVNAIFRTEISHTR